MENLNSKDNKKRVVIYVHGFLSSAQAQKAQDTKEFLAKNCPNIEFDTISMSDDIKEAFKEMDLLVNSYISKGYIVGLIGSSMGGFISTLLVNKYNIRSVLVNPCLNPWDLIRNFIGTHTNPYTQNRFTITEESIQTTKDLRAQYPIKQEYHALYIETGDEVLDYKVALEMLPNVKEKHLIEGGAHRFDSFKKYVADMVHYLFD